jgi:hypothetical protein
MVGARSDKICAIGTERTIPDPALMTMQSSFMGELLLINRPNLRRVVCGAGSEMSHIRRKQHSRDVLEVRLELGDRHQLCNIAVLNHLPHITISLHRGQLVMHRTP